MAAPASVQEKEVPPSVSNIHVNVAATSTSAVNEKDIKSDPSGTHVETANSPISTTTVARTPERQGFWKQRLSIRPPVDGDPRVQLSRFKKGLILAIISQAGCLGGFSSTIYVGYAQSVKSCLIR
jgi:hypothetical protein